MSHPKNLATNFPEKEFIHSQTAARFGIKNTMNKAQRANAKKLCTEVLQPYRDHIKSPVSVTSGFRNPQLNTLIGGSSTSYHMEACAADVRDSKKSLEYAANWMMDNCGEHIDQIIYEYGSWLHVQIAKPGRKPRKRFLTAYRKHGRTYYEKGLKPELTK